jgi:hypothetical protein
MKCAKDISIRFTEMEVIIINDGSGLLFLSIKVNIALDRIEIEYSNILMTKIFGILLPTLIMTNVSTTIQIKPVMT